MVRQEKIPASLYVEDKGPWEGDTKWNQLIELSQEFGFLVLELESLRTVAMPYLETLAKPLVSTYDMQIVPSAPKPESSSVLYNKERGGRGRIEVAAALRQQRPWEHIGFLPTHVPVHEESVLLNTLP